MNLAKSLKNRSTIVAAVTVVVIGLVGGVTYRPWASAAPQVAPGATCHTSSAGFNANIVTPVAIGDNDGTLKRISIDITNAPAGATVWDVDVVFGTDHTYPGDLVVTLTSPDQTAVTLASHNGFASDWGSVTFDDQGASAIDTYVFAANTPVIGELRPTQPLSAFRGKVVNGRWDLRVADDAAGDAGSITSWAATVTACGPPDPVVAQPQPQVTAPVPPSVTFTGTCGATVARACKGATTSRFAFRGTLKGDGVAGSQVELVARQRRGAVAGTTLMRAVTPGADGTFKVTTARRALAPGLWELAVQLPDRPETRSSKRYVLISGYAGAPFTPQVVTL